MAKICIDPVDGMLSVRDSYDVKDQCATAGCFWDSVSGSWKITFTLRTFEDLIDRIPEAEIGPEMEGLLVAQADREDRLSEIRAMAEKNEDIDLHIPGLKKDPFPYQKLGILYGVTNGRGLIIADVMGLGKTVQAIAIALSLKAEGRVRQCLVVTPASLKFNWPLEVEKFTGEKSVVVGDKNANADKRISQWLDESAFFKIVNYELLDDLFCTRKGKVSLGKTKEERAASLAKAMQKTARQAVLSKVREKVWDMIVFDEIHMIKHETSQRYRSVRSLLGKVKVGLTGTPMDGRLEELYAVCSAVAPGVLGSRTSFFGDHVVVGFDRKVKSYKNISDVKRKIAPFFIRRLKKDVLPQLPDKIYENKIISLTSDEMRIYEDIKHGRHKAVKDAEAMVRAIRCKQFCNFPHLVDHRCRPASKLNVFLETLEEAVQSGGEKAIVFTQYRTMLDVIDKALADMGLRFLRIDGSTDKKLRADFQAEFNTNKKIDCIIGTDAMSTGLNLTGASIVFNYDDNWQPAVMAQREDRAHRYGQTRGVTVMSFVCKDTIEEKIRGVLYAKDKITSETLGDNADEMDLKRFGNDEMERLM